MALADKFKSGDSYTLPDGEKSTISHAYSIGTKQTGLLVADKDGDLFVVTFDEKERVVDVTAAQTEVATNSSAKTETEESEESDEDEGDSKRKSESDQN